MSTIPSVSVLVNARLLSTRLPRKMVRPFAGTTLIDIALGKLSRMDFFAERYFAAAEDELKAKAARHPNVRFLQRETDAVKPGYNGNEKVFAHCRQISTDYILWLNPCAPLLSEATLRRAFDHVLETRHNSYTSVIESRDWIFDSSGLPVTNKSPSMISTAHSEKYFKVAHTFHVLHTKSFLETFTPWTLSRNDPALIEIPEEESFDVNTPVEFEVAEVAYRRAESQGGGAN